jgi:hypothetical protein
MTRSRREFMKLAVASGITLGVSRIASAQVPPFLAHETLPGRGVWKPAVGRIDGVAKATGARGRLRSP